MNRSSNRLAAVLVALLLTAAPAAAIGPAEEHRQSVEGRKSGWLMVLADWVEGWIGNHSIAASDADDTDGEPPQAGEPPADSETDRGPDWDPNG